MDLNELVTEYENVALKLGGVLLSARPENQPEWLVSRDKTITDAQIRLNELRDEFERVTVDMKQKENDKIRSILDREGVNAGRMVENRRIKP